MSSDDGETINLAKVCVEFFSPAKWHSWWLARRHSVAPAVPALQVIPRLRHLHCSFMSKPTSPYNRDTYEVEIMPMAPELRKIMGTVDWLPAYTGARPRYVLGKYQPDTPFKVRARCVNHAGASEWAVWEGSTCAEPKRWGGEGPGYVWDQTPYAVEAWFDVPEGTASRDVRVQVLATKLRVDLKGELHVAGRLGGEVRCGDAGDWEWELEERVVEVEVEKKKQRVRKLTLKVTLQKVERLTDLGHQVWHPQEQWDCLFDKPGHPKVDMYYSKWERTWDFKPTIMARTPEEVQQVFPDNKVHDVPLNEQRPDGDEDAEGWGASWQRKNRA